MNFKLTSRRFKIFRDLYVFQTISLINIYETLDSINLWHKQKRIDVQYVTRLGTLLFLNRIFKIYRFFNVSDGSTAGRPANRFESYARCAAETNHSVEAFETTTRLQPTSVQP